MIKPLNYYQSHQIKPIDSMIMDLDLLTKPLPCIGNGPLLSAMLMANLIHLLISRLVKKVEPDNHHGHQHVTHRA